MILSASDPRGIRNKFSSSKTSSFVTRSATSLGTFSCGTLFSLPYNGVDRMVISRFFPINAKFFFLFKVLLPTYATRSLSETCAPSNASSAFKTTPSSLSKFSMTTLTDHTEDSTSSFFLYNSSLVLTPNDAFKAAKIFGLGCCAPLFSSSLFAVCIKL